MKFEPLELDGLIRISLESIEDSRGAFARQFCSREFSKNNLNTNWVQMNHSVNKASSTIRGLHFQRPPFHEVKMVRCLRGRVFDIAVDLRADSPSFGQWHGEELSDQNGRALYIPAGFAHGFQVLEPDSELFYWHSNFYEPDSEGGVNPLDPLLGIDWPLPPETMSPRDQKLPQLSEIDPIKL